MFSESKKLNIYMRLLSAVLFALGLGVSTANAANFLVTTEADSGPGSLRQAIVDANANGNPLETDIITFDPAV